MQPDLPDAGCVVKSGYPFEVAVVNFWILKNE
jgi:hypothetical protein